MTYFDHNATAPLHPAAKRAWLEAADKFVGNPSSPHRVGARADAALEDARERLAAILGCQPAQLVWTSGATEANNQVFCHFSRVLPPEATVCVSAIEHPSVLESAGCYFGSRARLIPVSREGVADLDWLREALATRRPGLVALMAANNVTGVIQPWREAARLCRDHGVPYFCDVAQWLGRESADGLSECEIVSGCAHKVGGPRGIGFLKCPSKGPWGGLIHGGPQEGGRRAGTENVAGALALVAAMEARVESLPDREDRLRLRDAFTGRLKAMLPGVAIVGGSAPRLWNTVAALLPEIDCRQRWVVKLDKLGVAVSTGSACSSGKEAASPTLLAMGYSPPEAGRVLRFSGGWETTPEEWETLLTAIQQAALELGAPLASQTPKARDARPSAATVNTTGYISS